MANLIISCEDYDFSALSGAFSGEFDSDAPLSAEIIFTDEEGIKELNARTRGVDSVTDVLSYPSFDRRPSDAIKKADHPYDEDEDGNIFIGSVVICRKRAEEQAEEYGHSVEREINYLAAHGICHLLGYDHMTDEDKPVMRAVEERVLSKINLSRDEL